MRYRWYYFKRWLLRKRPQFFVFGIAAAAFFLLFLSRNRIAEEIRAVFQRYGVLAVSEIMEDQLPNGIGKDGPVAKFLASGLEQWKNRKKDMVSVKDPAYRRMLQGAGTAADEAEEAEKTEEWETEAETEKAENIENAEDTEMAAEAGTVSESVLLKKLADYDYLMKKFYAVHPTAAAGRDMMDAAAFLSMDLSLKKDAENPQILIYHTHSQEEFADYPENPDATIVGVGERLKEELEKYGYHVIHDTSVYDVKDGKLDRSQAYTYALDGITGILQKYPSVEVVLDIHRDGVAEGTRLVTEINGKKTAKIMFFNGTSQTPDGPIEYLPNPNRQSNMAFSFQMQLLASKQYPEFTRKIYLKGLRYNQHVRARSALVEVGAQTNTYAEALNAMEPLAELLNQVLEEDSLSKCSFLSQPLNQ